MQVAASHQGPFREAVVEAALHAEGRVEQEMSVP
jgi:hypothetical protein